MKSEKLRRLTGRSFPWRHDDGENQEQNHPVQNREVQLFVAALIGTRGVSGARIGSQGSPALSAEAAPSRFLVATASTGWHGTPL